MSTTQEPGSAAVHGRLWGARARDWANIQEGRSRTNYEVVFERLGLFAGVVYCDVGCGAGSAAFIASQCGARVSGLDAAENLIEIARERVPRETQFFFRMSVAAGRLTRALGVKG